VSEGFDKFPYSKLSHALLIGGTSMEEQHKSLHRGVEFPDRHARPVCLIIY